MADDNATRRGDDVVLHPDEQMTPRERAEQMWRVSPTDLDRLGLTRQYFYLLHINAAMAEQRERDAKIAEATMTQEWREMDGIVRTSRNGACEDVAFAIRQGKWQRKFEAWLLSQPEVRKIGLIKQLVKFIEAHPECQEPKP